MNALTSIPKAFLDAFSKKSHVVSLSDIYDITKHLKEEEVEVDAVVDTVEKSYNKKGEGVCYFYMSYQELYALIMLLYEAKVEVVDDRNEIIDASSDPVLAAIAKSYSHEAHDVFAQATMKLGYELVIKSKKLVGFKKISPKDSNSIDATIEARAMIFQCLYSILSKLIENENLKEVCARLSSNCDRLARIGDRKGSKNDKQLILDENAKFLSTHLSAFKEAMK